MRPLTPLGPSARLDNENPVVGDFTGEIWRSNIHSDQAIPKKIPRQPLGNANAIPRHPLRNPLAFPFPRQSLGNRLGVPRQPIGNPFPSQGNPVAISWQPQDNPQGHSSALSWQSQGNNYTIPKHSIGNPAIPRQPFGNPNSSPISKMLPLPLRTEREPSESLSTMTDFIRTFKTSSKKEKKV